MKDILRQVVVIATFVLTLVLNGLASSGTLGGLSIGDISDLFNIYFVPASLTFAIWGVIYFGLGAFVVYHTLPSQRENPYMRRIGWLFVISNIANTAWILLFQSLMFVVSVFAMFALLATLIAIYLRLDIGKPVSRVTYWLIQVPFSIYMAWITIAAIANVSQALFANGYESLFGISGDIWAIIMLVIGTGIISAVIYLGRNVAYALTAVWALAGIVIAQYTPANCVGPVAIGAIIVVLGIMGFSLWEARKSEPDLPTNDTSSMATAAR
ncbi:tryptophan-rich sensory protein [Chloroflexota bacterium]